MVVQDPNFWRRFSTAVHQDDAEKSLEAQSGTSTLKHAYVTTSTSTSTNTPCTPLSPNFSITSSSPLQRDAVPFPAQAHMHAHAERDSKSMSFISQSISFTGGPLTGPQSPYYTSASQPSSPRHPRSKQRHADRVSRRISGFTRHVNASALSFSALAGRPGSQFRFCTTITADAPSSDSWLASQKKKQRQRAWMCWAFWLTLAAVVAGVVVAVLLLKSKKII